MKTLSIILIGLLVSGLLIAPVFAQDTTPNQQTNQQTDQQTDQEGTQKSDIEDYPFGTFEETTAGVTIKPRTLLETALNWVFNIVLVVSIIVLIYSGYLYATAGGDATKTKKAMTTLIYAIIGIAIALAARALVDIVAGFLGKQEGVQFKQ
ncbi:MAG: hypothetical protein AB7D02_02000 [Candidatus Paceibacterota bacterium]